MFYRNLILLMVLIMILGNLCGCSARETAQENPPSKVVNNEETPPPPLASPDLKGYPMPTELPGQENMPGRVTWTAFNPKSQPGKLLFTVEQETLKVVAQGVDINCCTERLAGSYVQSDAGIQIMIYEYLPDVCECFHKRNLEFNIFPVPASSTLIELRSNDREMVHATGLMP